MKPIGVSLGLVAAVSAICMPQGFPQSYPNKPVRNLLSVGGFFH
jgi:hypothetical protein